MDIFTSGLIFQNVHVYITFIVSYLVANCSFLSTKLEGLEGRFCFFSFFGRGDAQEVVFWPQATQQWLFRSFWMTSEPGSL